jgi:phenylacetate-CoA ligase
VPVERARPGLTWQAPGVGANHLAEFSAAPRPDELDEAERMSADELAALQLDRLRSTLRLVYDRVEHYHEAFDAAGVTPEDCTSLDDLAKFPFTAKRDLRDHYPFGLFAVPMSEVSRIHASSGTTGRPTVVGYTAGDIERWAELVARCIRASGGRPGHRVHVAYGYGLFTGGLGAHYGAERLGCTVIPVSGGFTERQVQLITDFEPEIIMVTPSYMLAILDEFRRQGIDPTATSLRVGIFGAEPWTEQMRAEIEASFEMHAVDIYGLSEVMGPGVANECIETKDGLQIWEDHFYPEIVDPATGVVLPDGEQGELVFTTLTKEALPVIRYRTGDLTRLLPGTARPNFRRMAKITGRSDDMLIVRGVNLFPTQVEELVLQQPALSPHFTLVLTRPERLDVLTVRVETRPEGVSAADREAAGAALEHAVKARIGVSCTVEVIDPDTLERSMGKLRRVYDQRG